MTTDALKCCGCAHVKGTPYGGIGPKRCLADERRRNVIDYYHINPSTGLPLASYLKKPRPDWCPRVIALAEIEKPSFCPSSVEPEKPETWRHLVAVVAGERQAA